jgi:hypothetical protein
MFKTATVDVSSTSDSKRRQAMMAIGFRPFPEIVGIIFFASLGL